jgi:hypothetical protein
LKAREFLFQIDGRKKMTFGNVQFWARLALPGVSLLGVAIGVEYRRFAKFRDLQEEKALRVLDEIESDLPRLQPFIHCPGVSERHGGLIHHHRADDKTIIEYMGYIGHRPALHDAASKALEAGLIRLHRILGLYHSYTGTNTWWEKQWFLGKPVLNDAELLFQERSIRKVLNDTRAAIRGEQPSNSYEWDQVSLLTRPLYEPRVRILNRSWRRPERWAHGAVPRRRWPSGRLEIRK